MGSVDRERRIAELEKRVERLELLVAKLMAKRRAAGVARTKNER